MIILGPVAVAKNGVIGGGNDLPWYFPEDLKHFKEITMGKTVLMGRKTYDSIFKRLGKPLPGRKNVVITRDQNGVYPEGVLVFNDPEAAVAALPNEDIYVIGGAQIYSLFLPKAEKMFMTHVHKEYPGDAFFPEVNWDEWEKIEEEPHDQYTYSTYIRK
nr:Dihydrofolate reductase [uncultured bacterium]AIA16342.1 Dihydrofolate reductase [uncultured bacterium]